MAETYSTLSALFTDIADAIREKTGETASIVADDFPSVIRRSLQVKIREDCLTFSSPSAFSIKTNNTSKNWDGTLEYSTNKKSWIEWNGEEISAASGADGYVLYFSGIGNTIIAGNNSNYKWVLTGSDISCIGNIETLLDYATVEFGNHPTMAPSCYDSMFNGCTSLTQAPVLPATTLIYSCYYNMFQDCTSLTQAPALPATTLANYCYQYMFRDCTSIKLSTARTGEYTIAYRIPMSGTGTTATRSLFSMFTGTGGTFTETPEINTTYYLSNTNTVV